MLANTERIFVSILLVFWCVYLRDGNCAQLSYNFLYVSILLLYEYPMLYLNCILYLHWYLLWSIIYIDTYSFCLSRKKEEVFLSQYFPIFFLFLYIFSYISPTFLKIFSSFFSYIFQCKPWKAWGLSYLGQFRKYWCRVFMIRSIRSGWSVLILWNFIYTQVVLSDFWSCCLTIFKYFISSQVSVVK